ncbi:beta-lactamase [Thraustotheca clavata]|uniref:Beta-lactamase n=1 Tax=Thraustotheca clavata TaxID=74557 RepID=A0A1V9ZJR7_9STRA|nr:beta-lactamase [Thraustotheca clavata]
MKLANFPLLLLAITHVHFMMGLEQSESNGNRFHSLSVLYKNQTVIAQGIGLKQYGNASNVVTADTLFQIDSYSKTFIGMGIAKLVDEGKMVWSMNSVFGDYGGDSALILGVVPTEREIVKSLAYLNKTRALRSGYAYTNAYYEILGEVIEYKSIMTWSAYLDSNFFKPLWIHHTYSCALDVLNTEDLSFDHNICNGKVAGPYHLKTSPEIFIWKNNSYIAAGSIISSASDLSKFSRFLLNKGEGIFNSTKTISSMITGQTISPFFGNMQNVMGLSYSLNGNAVAAGYGLDIIGDVMYGYHYFDKGGDTSAFKARNGFIPNEELAVVLLSNAQAKEGVMEDLFLQDRI